MEVSNTYIQQIYQLNYPALVGQLLSPTIQPEERDIVLRRLLEINNSLLRRPFVGPAKIKSVDINELADDIFTDDPDTTNPVISSRRDEHVVAGTPRVNPYRDESYVVNSPNIPIAPTNKVAREKITTAIDRIHELSQRIKSRKS